MKYVNIFLCSCALTLAACTSTTNPTPDIINPDQISYDEYGDQTGGLRDIIDGKYFVITPETVNLYNALIDKYGDKIIPALKHNDGIKSIEGDSNYIITPKYMQYFMFMAELYRLELANTIKEE